MSRIYTVLFALAGLAALAAVLNWSVLRSVFTGDPNEFVEEMVLEEPIMIEGPEAGLDYHLVTLFFGTNRGVLRGEFDRPAERFSNEDSGILTYGTAEVSIPFDHEVGVIEALSGLRNFSLAKILPSMCFCCPWMTLMKMSSLPS